MRNATKEFLHDARAGAGAVLLIVLFTFFPMLALFSIVIFLTHNIAYLISPENCNFLMMVIIFYSTISAFWLYPKIKEEINKNKKGL